MHWIGYVNSDRALCTWEISHAQLSLLCKWQTQPTSSITPLSVPNGAVVTDPPYYDAINYADLSDFFYVWLKRSDRFSSSGLAKSARSPLSGSRS